MVKALMSLRGVSQSDLSRKTGVSLTALNRYLKGDSELRSDLLHRVLASLGADVEGLLRREINRALGTEDNLSLGEDIAFLLQNADPITRKTIADTLIASFKAEKSPELRTRVHRVKQFRDSIKTVGRINC